MERLNILYREITLAVYTNVSRGLFERHKLVFSFMLCVAINQEAGKVDDSCWNYLLRGPIGAKIAVPKKPDYPTLSEPMWVASHYLSRTYEKFEPLPDDILNGIYVRIGDFDLVIRVIPESRRKSKIPWDEILDDFEKLMLLKTLREEKLVFAITEYVKINLGKAFIESPQVSLQIL